MKQSVNIVLASGSLRRKEMFERMGLRFTIIKSEGEEIVTETDPAKVVASLSKQKAEEVAEKFLQRLQSSASEIFEESDQNSTNDDRGRETEKQNRICPIYEKTIIVGADTVVASGQQILGKPADEEDAVSILMTLSGKEHEVLTGVHVICLDAKGQVIKEDCFDFVACTKVKMYPFTKEEAEEYVATGEPMDKAGAYGIQGIGAVLVEEIAGDYNTVVGFPLSAFIRQGRMHGFFS